MSCPECQSVRTRTRETGWDADGRTLRAKACGDCRHQWFTLEVVLPKGYSIRILSPWRKWRARMKARERRGYHGTLGGAPLKPEPIIDVEIKVRSPA